MTSKKNDPVDDALAETVKFDMFHAKKSGQWLLSSYTPFVGKPPYPGFKNKSFEEVRFEFYEATANGSVEQYNNQLRRLIREVETNMRALENPSEETINTLKQIYRTPVLTKLCQTNAFNKGTNFERQTEVSTFNLQSVRTPISTKVSSHLNVKSATKSPFSTVQQQEGVKWICSKCHQPQNVPSNSISDEQEEVNSKSEIISAIDEIFKSQFLPFSKEIKQEVNTCTEYFSKQVAALNAENALLKTDIISELEERIKRTSNVILYNIPESNHPDPKSRREDDIDFLKHVLCGTNGVIEIPETSLLRIGKVGERPRPIKLHFNSKEDASRFIKMCKTLKLGDIRVGPDRTPLQSKLLNEARATLEERRNKGEENLAIKFIKGVPQIVTNRNAS